VLAVFATPAFAQTDAVARGGYIFAAAGCAGCHTDVKNNG
jgi:mono/diheme cytochrome c family protein